MIDSSARAPLVTRAVHAKTQQKRTARKADFEVLTTMIFSWLVPHERKRYAALSLSTRTGPFHASPRILYLRKRSLTTRVTTPHLSRMPDLRKAAVLWKGQP